MRLSIPSIRNPDLKLIMQPSADSKLFPSKIFSSVSFNEVTKPYMKVNSTNYISSQQIYSRSDPKTIRMFIKPETENKSQVKEGVKAILKDPYLKDIVF